MCLRNIIILNSFSRRNFLKLHKENKLDSFLLRFSVEAVIVAIVKIFMRLKTQNDYRRVHFSLSLCTLIIIK